MRFCGRNTGKSRITDLPPVLGDLRTEDWCSSCMTSAPFAPILPRFDAALARRGLPPASPEILARDAERRAALTALQEKQARRNALSREVGQQKRAGADTSALEAEAAALRGDMEGLERRAGELDEAIKRILEALPNILDPDVPDGPDESANVVLKQHGEPRDLGFQPKQHFELGEALGLMDFATAAKLAGARFVVLRGALARLERALGQFMLDLHTREHGYTEMVVPSLVNDATAYGTDQLPKFADDLFRTTDGRWLIPTAEVPLTNTVAGDIVAEKDLPIRITALTDCFRSEAGAAGRDTRGMLRQHQFRKVEMVSITHPDHSADGARAHDALRGEGAEPAGDTVPPRGAVRPAIPAFARRRPSIWRSGCPASRPGARSAPAPTAATSRRGG